MMDSHLDSVILLSKTCSSALSTVITTTRQGKTAPTLMEEGKCRYIFGLNIKVHFVCRGNFVCRAGRGHPAGSMWTIRGRFFSLAFSRRVTKVLILEDGGTMTVTLQI